MNDICNFIPQRNIETNLHFIHFVYETNIKKLSQPFIHANYYLHIVNKGSALLKSEGKIINLKKGDLFFTFPNQNFTIEKPKDFTYLYISFNGEGATKLLNSLDINKDNFIFTGYEHLLRFWMDSIVRVNNTNAFLIAESVLTNTLSYLSNKSIETQSNNKFDFVISYINHNYTSKDMSIKKIAGIFFYSEKYLSSLFVKKTGTRFSEYLNTLRIEYAKKLITSGQTNISEVYSKCGYSDYFYFSKVFKKIVGKTPTQYTKKGV